MFVLDPGRLPANRTEMEAALARALGRLLTIPAQSGRQVAALEGGQYPHLASARIDLDDASVALDRKLPQINGTGNRKPGITVERFFIAAHPVRFRNAGLHLDVSAEQTEFEFDCNAQGDPLLLLVRARNGQIKARITLADIETLLLAGARQAASNQGIVIEDTSLTLRTLDARSIDVNLSIRAKKAFFRTTVPINGRLVIDDHLNATISGLNCRGEGPVGIIVSSLITPHLEKYNGTRLPLMTFSLGDVKLRDIQLNTQNGLEIRAAFGS
jgi:hypothetical protein